MPALSAALGRAPTSIRKRFVSKKRPQRAESAEVSRVGHENTFTLDPSEAQRAKLARAYRLNVVQIPLLRGAGFALLSLIALIHDLTLLAKPPGMSWRCCWPST